MNTAITNRSLWTISPPIYNPIKIYKDDDDEITALKETPFNKGQWEDFKAALKRLEAEKEKAQEVQQKSALDTQVGGSHYKGFKIQPFEFFIANKVPFHKADIIKRILRYDLPTGKGLEDLKKIKHEIDLIIQLEGLK